MMGRDDMVLRLVPRSSAAAAAAAVSADIFSADYDANGVAGIFGVSCRI